MPMTDRQRVAAWRGPWWWRALARAGRRLDVLMPDDRRELIYRDEHGRWTSADVRVPPHPTPLSVWRYEGDTVEVLGADDYRRVRVRTLDAIDTRGLVYAVPARLLREEGVCLARGQ